MTITAAVDGSSLGNPGPAGWAWVISEDLWAAGGWPSGTNNMGELTALLELLRATADRAEEPLIVMADSKYTIDSVTKWMAGWKRKGWRKADGQPVKNQEIIMAIDDAMVGRDVRFEWVKGHAGHPMNEKADDLARGAAEAFKNGTPVPSGPGFTGDVPVTPPLPEVFSSAEVPTKWQEIARVALTAPVKIIGSNDRALVLMDASLAQRAMAALEGAS